MNGTMMIHGITKIKVMPVERSEANNEDGSALYWGQDVILKGEDGDEFKFTAFFADAVAARLEREEREKEIDRCQAMEQLAAKSCCHHNA